MKVIKERSNTLFQSIVQNKNINGVTIEDPLKFTNASYEKDSIRDCMVNSLMKPVGGYSLVIKFDVTDQHRISRMADEFNHLLLI